MRYIILSLLLIGIVSSARQTERLTSQFHSQSQPPTSYPQEQHQFKQILDHFNLRNSTFWTQRYWVANKNSFHPKIGPVFLYICGEGQCKGVPDLRQWVVNLANQTQGLILVLEHRFYGKSLPFTKLNESFHLDKLAYLNSEQALKDLAYFIEQMTANKSYGIAVNSPWISIGGSYPGALSAWFRSKYPHLTIGAIASSAVVEAINDFQLYDAQIEWSTNKSGVACPNAIKNATERISKMDPSQFELFKAGFEGGVYLNRRQFLYYWSDSIAGQVQYGARVQLCKSLTNKTADAQFNLLVNLTKNNNPYEYSSFFLSNLTEVNSRNLNASRAWNFQCCTEFGWWQTASSLNPFRSPEINLQFFEKFCFDTFGVKLTANVEHKNNQFGGAKFQATNLLMTNGVEDPWRWASLQDSRGGIISRVANCSNCAHCVDLYSPSKTDAPQLKKIRSEQMITVQKWIENYWYWSKPPARFPFKPSAIQTQ